VGQHDRVRVGVQDPDRGLGLDECFDLVQDEVPLKLILRLVRAGVVGYLGVELLHELPHEFHAVQQQADDDEAGVIPELLHHQIAPVLLGSAAVVSATAYRRIERIGLVQIARFAGTQVVVVVELADFAGDLADLPPLEAVLRVQDRPETDDRDRTHVNAHVFTHAYM